MSVVCSTVISTSAGGATVPLSVLLARNYARIGSTRCAGKAPRRAPHEIVVVPLKSLAKSSLPVR